MQILQITFCILAVIQSIFTQEYQQIFSPWPFHVTGLKRIENTMQQLEISEKAGLIFLAIGEEGLIILEQKAFNQVAQIKDRGQIDRFSVTLDGKYLFFSYQDKISIFQLIIQPSISLELICQDNSEHGQYVNELFLFNDEKWAAGASMENLVVYDISNKNQMKILGLINVSLNPFYVVYLLENHLFIVGNAFRIIRFNFDKNNNSMNLSIVMKIAADYGYSSVVITKDQKYIYTLDNWGGLYFGKFLNLNSIKDGDTKEDFEFDVKNWWPTNQSPLPNEIRITKDEKFIIVGVQQLGLYIFDISNREVNKYPKLFQWIRSTGYSYSVKLSSDEKYLYYVNGISLQVYGLVQPNLNNNYPNLFNIQQANFTVVGKNIYRWRCYITKNDEYFIGAFDKDGLFIFDLKKDPLNLIEMQDVIPDNLYYTESAIIDEENGYIITPGDTDGALLFVYDMKQIRKSQKIKPTAILTYEDKSILLEGIRYSYDKKYIGLSAYSTLILVDSSKGPLQLKVQSTFSFNNEVVELIFSACRNFGFICIKIDENNQLTQVKYLKTSGGFSIVQSQDWRYAFVCEGAKGVGIIDLNLLPEIVFISRVAVEGTTMHITPIQNDKYFLVSSNVEGFLTLIDASNKQDLSIISKFIVYGQNGLSSCVNSDESYAFLTNGSGITSLPIKSKIEVHTEIFLIEGRETKKIVYLRQKPDQILLIGQTFQFQFYQIYPITGARLTNILYYQNYQLANLPFWIIFNQQVSSINLEVVKDVLGDDVAVPTFNTIILEHKIPLTSKQFQFDIPENDGVIISEDLSLKIHAQLKKMELLNYENFLISNNFERNENFRFNDESMNDNLPLLDKVKKILQQSVYYNPVMFKVESSLLFFPIPQQIPEFESQNPELNGKDKYFVFSIQNTVQVYIEVKRGVGKFVEVYYDGVIAQISNYATHLKLEGTVKNINNIFTQKILFFKENASLSNDEIELNIILKDGVNYVLEKQIKLTDALTFINLKKAVYLNQQKLLQTQFNSMFADGSVSIQDNLSFEFSKDTFINEDTQVLNYKATFQKGSSFVDSVPGAWIQQSSNSLRFFGVVPIEEYRTVLHIKIEATDGYTTISDMFSLQVYNIPFVYIFSTLVKIFGPLLTILGFYKYRSYFFNFIFHTKNVYKKETCQVFSSYYKKITILADENEKAILLFKAFLSKANQIKLMMMQNQNINMQFNSGQSPDVDPYNQPVLNLFGTNPKFEDKQFQTTNENIFSAVFDDIDKVSMLTSNNEEKNFMQLPLQSNSTIKSILEEFIKELKKLQNDKNNKIKKKTDEKQPDEESNQNMKTKGKKKQQLEFNKNNNNFLIEFFMNETGQIKMKQIIKLMIDLNISITHKNQNITTKSIIQELTDPSSRMYQSLKAIFSRHLLIQHPVLLQIYKFLKQSAILESQLTTQTKNDWYFKYIKTIPEEHENKQKLLSFPKIQLLIDQIRFQIKLMVKILQNNNQFSPKMLAKLNSRNLPFKLILNVIIADSLGLKNKIPSLLAPSQGESIHLNFFEISSVQAYKKVKNLYCPLIRRFLKMDVMNYGSSKNQQLPSWMKFTLKSNAIILSGIPKQQDVETFIIRIYDDAEFIARQFEIQIGQLEESSPANILKINQLEDEDIQVDGLIMSPQDSPQESERLKLSLHKESINIASESFFSSENINSDKQKPPKFSKLNMNEQTKHLQSGNRLEDSPRVKNVLTSEFKIKLK